MRRVLREKLLTSTHLDSPVIKLTALWSLNHKVFKSLSLPGWEGGHFFAASFIYSFAELALVMPNAVDLSPSQFGVCGRCSFHVVTESSHLSQYSSCF